VANREIQPPGGDLGVNTGARSNVIDWLTFGGGRGSGGGGGRSGKDYKNEAELFKFQQEVLDERERAQNARAEMLHGNKTAIDLGGEQVSQTQGLATHAQFIKNLQDSGASSEQIMQAVSQANMDLPKGGSFGVKFDNTPVTGGGKPAPTNPDVPGEEPPVEPTPEKDMWDTDITRKKSEGKGGNNAKVDVKDSPLHWTQKEKMRSGWDDQLAAHQKELADAGEAPLDEEEVKQLAQEQSYAMFPLQGRQTAGLSKSQLEGNQPYISGNKATQKTISKMHPDAQFSDAGSISFGKVGNDGGIDLGTSGARPAPNGTSGVTQGTQFDANS
jgi:hypothetical protein